MSLGCYFLSRCMASLALRWPKTLSRCEPPTGRSTIRPSACFTLFHIFRHTEQWGYSHPRGFTTTIGLGRRKKPGAQNYPGFRNETKDQRLVREHKLFNPFSFDYDSPLARLGKPESLKEVTTLPVSETPTSELEREMLFRAIHNPPGARLPNLLDHIVSDRRERPQPSHYEALIHANASTDRGSAKNVRDLLNEMAENKIPMNVNTYTAVLRTLVVHPDVDLLDHVIDSCERSWIPLDSEMLHFISAAYLRADMPELAIEYLDLIEGNASSAVHSRSISFAHVADASGKVELWLYVLFLDYQVRNKDWDGVLRMCYRLNDDESLGVPLAMRQIDVPHSFWQWLILRASDSIQASWVVLWIWDLWVRRAWIRPSYQSCMGMLKVSARLGLYRTSESLRLILYSLRCRDRQNGQASYGGRDVVENADIDYFLNLAYKSAGNEVPRMTERERQRLIPHWWMFDDTMGIEKETGTKMRMDPWAGLSVENDPGRAWPRILQEREAEQKGKEEHRRTRKAVIRGKNPGEVMVAVRSWPGQLQEDLDALASLRLGLEQDDDHKSMAEESKQWVAPFIVDHPNKSKAENMDEHSAIDPLASYPKVQAEMDYHPETQAEPLLGSVILSDLVVSSCANTTDSSTNLASSRAPSNKMPSSRVNSDPVPVHYVSAVPRGKGADKRINIPIDSATSVSEADREKEVPPTVRYADDAISGVRDSGSRPVSRRQSGDGSTVGPRTKTGTMTSRQFFEIFAETMSDDREKG